MLEEDERRRALGHRRDATVHRVLGGCRVEPVSAELGRAAGELLGRTGRKDTVDAVVAVTAARLPGSVRVLTSDPSALRALTEHLPGVRVEAIQAGAGAAQGVGRG